MIEDLARKMDDRPAAARGTSALPDAERSRGHGGVQSESEHKAGSLTRHYARAKAEDRSG